MTNKSTKRALLTSVISMLICIVMLVGTTFAWFTDSVSSVNNVIKSGNLDVELYYQNDTTTTWTKVGADTNIFKTGTLWEPGHTEVVKLKVVNEGTLALKYDFGINIASEVGSVNVYEQPFNLSRYIYFGVVNGEQSYTRETAIAAVAADAKPIAGGHTIAGDLEAGEDSADVVTLVVYMPTTVGNEANYAKNAAVPTINLGLNLYATQYTSEYDSFNNLYDDGLEPSKDGVLSVEGGIQYIYTPDGEKILYLVPSDYAESTVYVADGTTAIGNYAFKYNSNVKTVILSSTVRDLGRGFDESTVENVVLNEGLTTISSRAFRKTYNLQSVEIPSTVTSIASDAFQSSGIKTIVIPESVTSIGNAAFNDSAVENVTIEGNNVYIDHYAFRDCENLTTVTILSDSITLGSGMIFTNDQSNNADPNNITIYVTSEDVANTLNNNADVKCTVVLLNENTKVADGLYANDVNYYVTEAAGLNNLNTKLVNKEITAKGMVLSLLSDVDMSDYTWTPVDSHADTKFYISEINGNGHTVSNLTINGQAMFTRFAGFDDVLVKDITFDGATVNSSKLNSSILTVHSYQNTTLDNVDVKNSTITGAYKVAPLLATFYDEGSTAKALTVKNCDVVNCTVKSNLDFMACGMIAWVDENGNESVTFENSTVSDTTIIVGSTGYDSVGYVYSTDGEAEDTYDSADGVTVTNCVKLAPNSSYGSIYTDSEGNMYVYDINGLLSLNTYFAGNSSANSVWGKTYNIMADIDADGYTWNSVYMVTGSNDNDGIVIDGHGHTITGLTISGGSMFKGTPCGGNDGVEAGYVKDITMDGATVTGNNWFTGVFWGNVSTDLVLDNAHVINSTVSGVNNVGALVASTGEFSGDVRITFKDCSVKNCDITAAGANGQDPTGASAFIGRAYANTSLVFEGNNVADNNTITNNNGLIGGGIYAYTIYDSTVEGGWRGTGSCDTFTNWAGIN